MKIQEIKLGDDYKEIEGTLIFANQQTQTITTKSGQSIPKQQIVFDNISGDFFCGQRPLTQEDCGKQMNLMCKANTYQGNTQYTFKRVGSGGGGKHWGGKSQQEIDETRRSVAFSYLVDKNKLGFPWDLRTFLYANILEKWLKDGQMPSPQTFGQAMNTSVSNEEDNPPATDDDVPF